MENLEIGTTVEWEVGNILARGIVYDPADGKDTSVIVCYEINGSPTKKKFEVKKEILRISNE